MNQYDYLGAVKQDVLDYIKEEITLSQWADDSDGLFQHLQDVLWTDDRVTGNASGSYTFSTWGAEENLCHNWDLLRDALEAFGEQDADILDKGAEWCDVTIRCFLLPMAIDEVLNELAWK